jgi:hypothetical protein
MQITTILDYENRSSLPRVSARMTATISIMIAVAIVGFAVFAVALAMEN